MQVKFKLKCFLAICFGLSLCAAFGHDTIVHWNITRVAADAASAETPGYNSFLDAVSDGNGVNFDILDSKGWMREGSVREDDRDADNDEGGKRSLNHFYDPLTGLGLSDYPGYNHPVTLGNNSFTWGSISNCPGLNFQDPFGPNINTKNLWSWQNARGYQWLALTTTNSADRYSHMTKMFRSAGQVMHLLEDTSQPQHVRNEHTLDNRY